MLTEPSLGPSILKARLNEAGIASQVYHANLDLLQFVHYDTYVNLAETWAICDFLFSGTLDNELDAEQIQNLHSILTDMAQSRAFWQTKFANAAEAMDLVLKIRSEAIPRYIEFCAERILEMGPTIVGFTCLFDQTFPSLAVAKHIRGIAPDIPIVFGGYSVAGETGRHLLECFDCIDFIFDGEGESAIVDIARITSRNQSIEGIQGLSSRTEKNPAPSRMEMDLSPTPDFDDFFAQQAELASVHQVHVANRVLPFEASRGCWWGQKNHCVFCGIDKETLKYTQRSAHATLSALSNLKASYGAKTVRFSDYILPQSYQKELIPALIEAGGKNSFTLTCEMKANVRDNQLDNMVAAGFTEVQPGIESFSTNVLKSMKKGVSALQNVVFLKNAKRLGLKVHYNLLYGFPDDEESDYSKQVASLPKLFHLEPPTSNINVLSTRNAPLVAEAESFGLPSIREAHPRYNVIFSEAFLEKTGFSYVKYCYYYRTQYTNDATLQRLYRVIDYQVEAWREDNFELSVEVPTCTLTDTRPISSNGIQTLEVICVDILTLIDRTPKSVDKIFEELKQRYLLDEIQVALAKLSDLNLTYEESDQVVGLPILNVAAATT